MRLTPLVFPARRLATLNQGLDLQQPDLSRRRPWSPCKAMVRSRPSRVTETGTGSRVAWRSAAASEEEGRGGTGPAGRELAAMARGSEPMQA